MRRARWTAAVLLSPCVLMLAPTAATRADETTPPAKPTASITLQLPNGSSDSSYVIDALGKPPTGPVVLTDDSGTRVATAQAYATADRSCSSTDHRATTLGTQQWCVHLTGVPSGAKLTGKLTGCQSVLTLTAQRRDPWWSAARVALLALAGAVLLSYLGAVLLPAAWPRFVLRLYPALLTNWWRVQPKRKVDGLAAWVPDARKGGTLAPADLLARTRWAARYGRDQVMAVRREIEALVVESTGEIGACPLRAAAEAEMIKKQVDRSGLLDADGTRVHPARDLLRAYQLAAGGLRDCLAICEGAKASVAPGPVATTIDGYINTAKGSATNFLSEFTLDTYLENLQDIAVAVIQASRGVGGARGGFAGVAGVAAVAASARRAADTGRNWAALATRSVIVASPMMLFVALLMIVASALSLVQYVTNPTFGNATDYATLAATAFTSSLIPAVVAAFVVGRGQRWYGQ